MPLGPMNVYDTAPVYHGQFKQNAAPYPLTGLSPTAIKLHISQRGTQFHKFGKGTVVIIDSLNGFFDYHWDSRDTNTPGIFDVWTELTLADGSVLSSVNAEPLQITNRKRGYTKYGMGRMCVS